MEKKLRRTFIAAGWLDIASCLLAAAVAVLFVVGLNVWTDQLDADLAAAALAVAVLYGLSLAVSIAAALVSLFPLGTGICELRMAFKGVWRSARRIVVSGLVFSAVLSVLSLFYEILLISLQKGIALLAAPAFGVLAFLGAALCAAALAAVAVKVILLVRLRRAPVQAQPPASEAASGDPSGHGG